MATTGFTAPVISSPNTRKGTSLSYWSFQNSKGGSTTNVVDGVSLDKGANTSLTTTSFALPQKGTGTTKSTSDPIVPQYIASPSTGSESDATIDIPIPTRDKTQLEVKSKYAHTADEIEETSSLHWFTEDERLRLIEVYNATRGGIDTSEDRIITWIVQPLQPVGVQNLLCRVPFNCNIVQATLACVNPGPTQSIVTIRKSSGTLFEAGTPDWADLVPLEMSIYPGQNHDMKTPDSVISLGLGDYLDIRIDGGGPSVAFATPITVQLAIRSPGVVTVN